MIVCNHGCQYLLHTGLEGKALREGKRHIPSPGNDGQPYPRYRRKKPIPIPYIVRKQCRIFFVLSPGNETTILKSSLVLQVHVKA